jgi:hypothetical protein
MQQQIVGTRRFKHCRRERIWPPSQKLHDDPDGCGTLTLKVNCFAERANTSACPAQIARCCTLSPF